MPSRSTGAVLFADVSGFTPLTAALSEKFGPQRGAEELSKLLNQVFERLIARVHRYGGSVIVFSGDAITCWFEGDNGRKATACAFEMQEEMAQFADFTVSDGVVSSLALKVAVAVGRANRFLVGHTHIQRLEALAGATLDRVAAAEQLLKQGETIVGAEVMAWFGNDLSIVEWRSDGRGEHFAVVDKINVAIPPAPWPQVSLKPEVGREWVMPPVAERVLRGEGDYLAQLRFSVALFLKFGGIDYDEDREAGAKLDVYIRWVQTVLARYEGYLLELTIGDKGSYLYIVFGTPLTHENDRARSISAALDLQTPPPGLTLVGPVQIGISQGMMRAGAYGSSQRRSYGIQGQEVNIAARLMSRAKPGQILVSGRILKATADLFEFESLGPLPLKGLPEPLPVYSVLGEKAQTYTLESVKSAFVPIVGRKAEKAVFQTELADLEAGRGGAIVIEGEAGIGKSRLVAEFLIEVARRDTPSLVGVGSEVMQSVAYHACRPIFRQLFGLREEDDTEKSWKRVTDWLELDSDDELLQKMPLLSVVLPFHIPDSALTAQMSGELRANNTYDLLATVLKKAAEKRPLVLAFEDSHWLDSASWKLVERLRWETLPLLLLIVTRPLSGIAALEEISDQYEHLLAAPGTRLILLKPLSVTETVELVCRRLGVTALPDNVGELIHARTEGHPLFSEELAVALKDTGLLQIKNGYAQLTTGLDELYNLGFPNTIQKVITSRIDRLTPPQQLALKVSSVLGRVFSYQTLHDVYPIAADQPKLDAYLDRLEKLAIIRMQKSGEAGQSRREIRRYGFKNAITQDIAYNLLLYEQRQQLHRAVGEWYETEYAADLTEYYAILAYHWQKSRSPIRAVKYLAKAAEQALKNGVPHEAVAFLNQLIELVERYEDEWQAIGSQLPRATQLAIWHRQLAEAYTSIGNIALVLRHARQALILLENPEPEGRRSMLLAFVKATFKQAAHRLFPDRFVGRRQDDVVYIERGRLALMLTEAYFFEDKIGLAFCAGMQAINDLEVAGFEGDELVRSLSNIIVGMSALPRNPFRAHYEQLAKETLLATKSLEAWAFFQFRLGLYYSGIGHWQEKEKFLQEAAEIYEQLSYPRMKIECLTLLGTFRNYRGLYDSLDKLGNEVYALASRQGNYHQMAWGLNLIAMDRLYRIGDSEQAVNYLESAAELMGDQKFNLTRELYLGWIAVAYLRLGKLDEARKAVEQINALLGSGPPFSAIKFIAYSAPALVYLTLWERAGKNADKEIIRSARTACFALSRFGLIFPVGRPRAALYWGLNHWLSGRKSAARRQWRKTIKRAVALEMPYEEGLAHFELARHLPIGHEQRDVHVDKAQAIFERIGARYDLGRCREEKEKENN